jgi:membrane protease YdiL (CAAX protease family)
VTVHVDRIEEPRFPLSRSEKRWIILEIVIVMALGLGRSAIYSVLSIVEKMTRPDQPLSEQTTTMNSSVTPDRPWLDLAYQVADVVLPLAHVMLVLYLLHLAYGRARERMGFDLRNPGGDLGRGFLTAAAIGIPGLAFYLIARELGFNTSITAANLTENWWTVPSLIAAAAMNGILEEVIMLGYLLARLDSLGLKPWQAIGISAIIRGAYHLYQGFGPFIGNVVMGVAFAIYYRRTHRVMPLIAAHTIIDIVSFVGPSLIPTPWLT